MRTLTMNSMMMTPADPRNIKDLMWNLEHSPTEYESYLLLRNYHIRLIKATVVWTMLAMLAAAAIAMTIWNMA